jgi:phenylalanyl-tRNA synthetase beta chain
MKVPLSWLKQFLDLTLTPKKIAETLTMLGIEVEKIEETAFTFSGIVVGKVVKADQHPNADRLRVATVTDGTEEYQVVCGAPNCREGIIVAFARIGASLTDAEGKVWKIKKSKLRDVESFGMLCSPVELGFAKESNAIIELPQDWTLGADLASFYSDPIFEISLTPNLGHALSVLGIARELAAALNLKIKKPEFKLEENGSTTIDQVVRVSVKDPVHCPRYACRALQNITVGPSPDWVVKKLEASGLRSINNVVDIANYVMLELGQPLHVFNTDTIAGKHITVSSSDTPLSIVTLDNKAREIPLHTLLISDEKKPLALAGIMGSLDSSATEKTKNIVIEAANFSRGPLRKTSRFLELKTDAFQRFDKEIDPEGVVFALDRAAFLIQQAAGGQIVKGMIDIKSGVVKPKTITVRTSRVNELLGTSLSLNEISSFLRRLEMEVEGNGNGLLTVTVPVYRNDISTEIDLVEEIGRIFGYNNLPKENPRYHASSLLDAPIYSFEKEIRSMLLQEGLQECVTCDLISPGLSKLTLEVGASEDTLISVLHPRSVDQSLLRTSLLPGLLQVVKNNGNFGINDIHAFEVGRIHFKDGGEFKEQSCAGIVLSGKEAPQSWDSKGRSFDFFDLKGMIENLAALLGIEKLAFEPSHLHSLHPWRQAKIKVEEIGIGAVGEVHPKIVQAMDIDARVLFAELNLHDLFPLRKKEKKSVPLPQFPGSDRDWTISLKADIPMSRVFHAMQSFKSPFLESFFLLDLYKSDQIGKDRKNATFRFMYRDRNKTIDVETVEREHQKLIQAVAEKLRDSII